MSCAPCFRAFCEGNSHSCSLWVIALPQYATAHLGSRLAASLKLWSACWYWKECNSATPVSRDGCASAAQLVGKLTWPSCGALAIGLCRSTVLGADAPRQNSESRLAAQTVMRGMAFPPLAILRPQPVAYHFLDASLQVRASHGEGKGGHFLVACC